MTNISVLMENTFPLSFPGSALHSGQLSSPLPGLHSPCHGRRLHSLPLVRRRAVQGVGVKMRWFLSAACFSHSFLLLLLPSHFFCCPGWVLHGLQSLWGSTCSMCHRAFGGITGSATQCLLLLWPHCSLSPSFYHPLLNMFSQKCRRLLWSAQRCHHLGRGAELCSAVCQMEPAGSRAALTSPHRGHPCSSLPPTACHAHPKQEVSTIFHSMSE